MTIIIEKITPTSEFHPAVGRTYIIELSNGERFPITDDELMEKYSPDARLDWEKDLFTRSW